MIKVNVDKVKNYNFKKKELLCSFLQICHWSQVMRINNMEHCLMFAHLSKSSCGGPLRTKEDSDSSLCVIIICFGWVVLIPIFVYILLRRLRSVCALCKCLPLPVGSGAGSGVLPQSPRGRNKRVRHVSVTIFAVLTPVVQLGHVSGFVFSDYNLQFCCFYTETLRELVVLKSQKLHFTFVPQWYFHASVAAISATSGVWWSVKSLDRTPELCCTGGWRQLVPPVHSVTAEPKGSVQAEPQRHIPEDALREMWQSAWNQRRRRCTRWRGCKWSATHGHSAPWLDQRGEAEEIRQDRRQTGRLHYKVTLCCY